MIQYVVFILAILLVPMAIAVKPQASYIGDTLFVPRSTDGDKHYLGEENADFFWKDENDSFGFRIWEYDTDADVFIRYVNNRTLGVKATSLSMTDIPIEICFLPDVELDIPGLKRSDFKAPVNCPGQVSLFYTMNNNTEYTFMFKGEIQPYRFYLGQGAGGGPGVGCSLACSPCYGLSINHGSTPSSTNTETNFNHQLTVSMSTCSGCTCPLQYYHRPFSTYTSYTSSYPSSFSNSVAKLISGSSIRSISTGGTYTNVLQCGGKHGSLFLRGTIEGSSGTLATTKTVTCTDASSPTITQWELYNNTEVNSSWINFSCSATDNTGLKFIDLYHNLSGSWTLNQSQSYGNLVYSANKTFSVTGIEEGINHGWECRARDTRSPNNDAYSGKRYWDTFLPVSDIIDDMTAFYAGTGLLGGLLIFGLLRKKKEEEGEDGGQ